MEGRKVTLLPYIITITLSSFLLFSIQPISAKALLPVFGGVPSVWNTCMVFFQGMLLAGYTYAFLVSRYLTASRQRWCHLMLVIASLCMLPVLWESLPPLADTVPVVYVLQILLMKISLPLFITCTTAPLVQSWFGETNHPDAKDPYFLYSASNAGSLLALLGFPFLLEPFIGRHNLSLIWSGGYAMFALLMVTIALRQRVTTIQSRSVSQEKIHWHQRCRWLLLSFAPSALLLAVTQYITINIVATPLLWLLPLTIYLLTFIIVFARKPVISHAWMVRELPYFLIFPLISLTAIKHTSPSLQLIIFHLLGFFALTMVCHGELAAKRPAKEHLTEFYLWMAFGGFLGGVFTSLITPILFNGVYEYYIALCLCILLCPTAAIVKSNEGRWTPLVVLTLLAAAYCLHRFNNGNDYLNEAVEIIVITIILLWRQRATIFALNVAILFLYVQVATWSNYGDLVWQSRNFFGVSHVYNDQQSKLHLYIDGATLHGAQFMPFKENYQALTYYRPVANIAGLLDKELTDNKPMHAAIAGLGTGTLSCAFRRDEVTIFEINPAVVKIANTPAFFSYLQNCPPKNGITLGDARTNIARTSDHSFSVIVLDTFSSDAIPTHMMTLEAVELYRQKLTAQGVLLFNISNAHVNLKPILAAIGNKLKMIVLSLDIEKSKYQMDFPSSWVMLTNNEKISAKLQNDFAWKILPDTNPNLIWTDDYSNILRVLK